MFKSKCINKIYSVSVVTGTGKCNANCSFCAGKYLRPQANNLNELIYPNPAKLIYHKNLEAAIKLCARYGGWSLSLTGSGEPTCSPLETTEVLRTYNKCAKQGAYFPNVNLFTNGILLGDDKFCEAWFPLWRELGLNNVVVSINSTFIQKQAEAYNVKYYPELKHIKDNCEKYGIGVRSTLLLNRDYVNNANAYKIAVNELIKNGYNNITSWAVCNPDGSRCKSTPSWLDLQSIRLWLLRNAKMCHGHSWGGGVYDYNGNILRFTDYVTKHNPSNDFVRQLVVFQDGTVSYSWIREGALCIK